MTILPEHSDILTIQLSPAECQTLAKAARNRARRNRIAVERSDFIPEPGKRNSSEARAEKLESAAAKLEAAYAKWHRELLAKYP